jgi:hypothetical protein
MNTGAAALTEYPELRGLAELRATGAWMFQPVIVHGELQLLTGARLWLGGWSDALAIRDRHDAKAFRCDPAGGEVWGREGRMADVVEALLALPAPGQPGAPSLVKATAPRLWTP